MSNTCPTRTRSNDAILSCEIATFAKRTLHGAGVMLAGGAPCQAAEKGKSECLVLHATLICVVRPRACGHCTCRLKSGICMEYMVLVCREFTGRKVVKTTRCICAASLIPAREVAKKYDCYYAAVCGRHIAAMYLQAITRFSSPCSQPLLHPPFHCERRIIGMERVRSSAALSQASWQLQVQNVTVLL